MLFNHPQLLYWGLPLVAVPVLIHLINLLRHRRVEWAAMEFLLKAKKKSQRWITLKQLLLLATRMAIVAVVVLIVAQWILPGRWTAMLGGGTTHHVVLLDDSFSMSDRRGDSAAFDRALDAVRNLATRLSRESGSQQFTLLTFSAAARASGQSTAMLQEQVDSGILEKLNAALKEITCSQTSAGPLAALDVLSKLPPRPRDETRIVYVVSDFRAGQWDEPADLKKQLARLDDDDTRIDLVACVEARRPNLAVMALQPAQQTRAAGVPLEMEVSVKNFGDAARRDVSLRVEEDGVRRPSIVIAQIMPGETASRKFPVRFASAGQHRIAVSLGDDAVTADNRRFCVVDFPLTVDVLIVDPDTQGPDAHRIAFALNPRYRAKTGIEPQIERPVLLRDQPLGRFAAVYLANVDRLDDSAIERLEQYVRGGGGLGIFVGEKTRADWVNDRLHRGGAGLMPAPLLRSVDLPVDRLNKAPDVEVTDHPVFFKFGNQRNSFLDTVLVQRYFALGAGWTPAGDESTRVIARLRNGSPLAVERSFGRGRVVAFLTKASSATTTIGRWNNWGDNPSYVVAIQQLQAYLAAGSYRDEDRRVATAIDVPVDPAVYAPRIAFTTPREAGSPLASVTVEARRSGEEPTSPVASLGRENMAETALAGVYLAHLARQDGAVDTRQFALNVDAQEGDLRTTPAAELATRLAGVPYRYYPAESLSADPRDQAGSNLSTWFLLIVVGLLAGEQLLAYSSSYHRASTGGDSA